MAPLKVMAPLLVIIPADVVGLEPNGKVQPEPMVTSALKFVLLILTEEKVTELQAKVESSRLLVPSKVTVPELAVNVPLVIVKFLSTDRVAEVEVKLPPHKLKAPSLMSI